jgi:hypothetical protein
MSYIATAEKLKGLGYAPAGISPGAKKPDGPWAAMQVKYTRDNLEPAVLTAIPPALGQFNGVVENPSDTHLVTLTVSALPAWGAGVAAIVDRFVGSARCPKRTDENGATTYVFRLAPGSGPFNSVSDFHDGVQVRVNSAASFVALAGTWTAGGLLRVPRAELAPLDRRTARELVEEITGYLRANAPQEPPPPRPEPPAHTVEIPTVGKLRWKHEAALERLRANGYVPAPIPWGSQEPVKANWRRCEAFTDDDGVAEDGVGIVTAAPKANRLVTLAINSPLDDVHALVAAKYGAGPVRVAPDGTRLYLFRASSLAMEPVGDQQRPFFAKGADGELLVTRVQIEPRNNALVLSGTDEKGKPYRWLNGDPLTTRYDELPVLGYPSRMILADIERVVGQLNTEAA